MESIFLVGLHMVVMRFWTLAGKTMLGGDFSYKVVLPKPGLAAMLKSRQEKAQTTIAEN